MKTTLASGPAPASSTIDADGDDERTELLYHWQDKRFYDEEQHQILTCGLLTVVLLAGDRLYRQMRKSGRAR